MQKIKQLLFFLKNKKIFLTFFILSLILSFSLTLDYKISTNYQDKIYGNYKETPNKETGVLLGTIKFLKNGKNNQFYFTRINTAAELFRNKKIKEIIISGDFDGKDYNEPETMKKDLIKKGVPENKITLDLKGYSTFETVLRANKIFKKDDFLLITQEFHCQRALFIAEQNNINASCFKTNSVGGWGKIRVRSREVLARVKAFADVYILNRKINLEK